MLHQSHNTDPNALNAGIADSTLAPLNTEVQWFNAAVNVFPDSPHRGAAWALPRALPGGLLFVQAPGVWGFSQVLSPGRKHGIFLY